MKSIKAKMIVFIGLMIGVICIGLGVISFISSSNALKSNLSETLPEIAEQTAGVIQGEVHGEIKGLESVAARTELADPNNSWENKKKILKNETERLGAMALVLVDTNGNTIDMNDVTDNVKGVGFYEKALLGESNVSDPSVSPVAKAVVVVYAVPLKYNGKIVGVLEEVRDGNALSELTNQVKVGKTGYAFMIKKDGTNIASTDKDKVMDMYNPIEEAKKDDSLKVLADIETKMGNSEKGIGSYTFNGVDKYIGYAPVKGTEWSVGVVSPKSEILSQLDSLKISISIASMVLLLIGITIIYFISNNISKGIKSTSKHLDLLANGYLLEEVSTKYLDKKDEIGSMTNSMKAMQEYLRNIVKKIKDNSSNVNIQAESLSSVSEEIASASENVTSAITEIAKGTSAQTNDLINITEILNTFSNKLSGIVKEIQVLDLNARNIGSRANESSSDMNELNESVTKISNSFKDFNDKIIRLGKNVTEITTITNMINGVAEQTNLLALNAAIEAARAGEAGKGFSVVADEIRKLSEQVKVLVENISKLVDGISGETEGLIKETVTLDGELVNQGKIINSSIVSFGKIIEDVNEVIPKIETVKNSAEDIEKDKNGILNRVDGLSSISVEISASSEEISASSEEMTASTQEVASSAQMLTRMTNEMIEEVNKFKI